LAPALPSLLVEVDEMTVPEAANALELPLNTAYSRLWAARFAFDQALARTRLRANAAALPFDAQ
jgi:hypothetical protein